MATKPTPRDLPDLSRLGEYQRQRRFAVTLEPPARPRRRGRQPENPGVRSSSVVQVRAAVRP